MALGPLAVAAVAAALLALAGGQSAPALAPVPAKVSSTYINRLLAEYGADGGGGGLTAAGLQRLLKQLGIIRHWHGLAGDHDHHDRHDHHDHHDHDHHDSEHTDHEHMQRAPADHESGLEHRDGGQPGGTSLLREPDHQHSLSHDHADHDHSADHGDHNHAEHDHTDHGHGEGHKNGTDHDHAGHDHADHAGHDHADHAGHDHADHDHVGHDHADHDHSADHADHDHAGHDHADHDHADHDHADHDHADHDHADHDHAGHDHAGHDHADHDHADHDHADHDHADHDHDHDAHYHGDHEAHHHGPTVKTPNEAPPSRASRELSRRDTSAVDPAGAATVADGKGAAPASCPDAAGLLREFGLRPDAAVSARDVALLCPALLYHAAADTCAVVSADGLGEPAPPPPYTVPPPKLWLFAGLSVLAISLCGLAGVAVVPIMQRVVYRQLLQFLVALAVGTLAGDALLHLLPHALTNHAAHGHGDSDGHDHGHGEEGSHLDAVLKGLVALVALVFFFAAERAIGILHGTCTRDKHKKINKRLAEMPGLSREQTEMIERKLKDYRHSAGANHCFGDRDTEDVLARLNTSHEHDSCPVGDGDPDADNHNQTPDCGSQQAAVPGCGSQPASRINGHRAQARDSEPGTSGGGRPGQRSDDNCERFNADEPVAHSSDFTVIIHEHEHRHHGHTHTHGHIHEPGGSAIAVAGMVIVGDGLHNFTDGMAIGAAFAAGLASGLSTSVAVFCHELPHEIGDFAVLLQSGMSVRQALFYNVVSSVLCLLGMVIGLVLGNMTAFSSWVFAGAAGSFLYIALVDMVPELTAGSSDSGSGPCSQLALQLAGMGCGAAIMLTIAIYEHELHSLITVL